MDYLSRHGQKALLETYKLHNCKRFHSMNAAIKYTGCCKFTTIVHDTLHDVVSNAIAFYSYRTRCFGWYPDADTIVVYPVVLDTPSISTARQCNRFLSEIVRREGLTVKELQRAYKALTYDVTTTDMYNLHVIFDDTSYSVLF